MSRKTIPVERLVDYANNQLKYSVMGEDFLAGVCTMVEQALHDTGNYVGFRYLREDEVPRGHRPGIRFTCFDESLPYPERFVDTNSYRRQYGMKPHRG